MAEVTEHQRADSSMSSEPVFDFYCELCREHGEMLEAEGFCVSCREYLCSTCYIHHRRSRGSLHHVLMNKDKMPKDRGSKDITKTCGDHPGKPVKYYCMSHEALGCSTCIFEGHKMCTSVQSIVEMAESVMESQEYKEFIQMLNKCDERARAYIQLVQDNLNRSKNCFSEVKESLKMFREEINSALDQLENNILTKAENFQKEEEQKLVDVSEKLTFSLESIEVLNGEINQLHKSKKECDIFIKWKESEAEITKQQSQLDEAERENVVTVFTFSPNTMLMENLRLKFGIGELSFQDSVSANAIALSVSYSVKTKATNVADIDVDSRHDCSITGSALLSNNRMVIVDEINWNVKLIDTQSNKVIHELKVSSAPWDVTVIGKDKVAVTLWTSNKILILSVSDTLTLDREIHTDGGCNGVAYNTNRLVVTYVHPGRLEIMDRFGCVLMTIKQDRNGHHLFNSPNYVCFSNDGEGLYVSDCNTYMITSVSVDGAVKAEYCDDQLPWPEQVCVDKDDNVFVCSRANQNVHMLTSDLIRIQIILTPADGLYSYVYSVTHCQKTNKLYVGMKHSNKVKVFQLSQ